MGSYKGKYFPLPFQSVADCAESSCIVGRIFEELKGSGENPWVRFIPTYIALMHTADGTKVLEINSRGGDPEIMNILPVLKNDFMELCLGMLEGNMPELDFENKATVVIYDVPAEYGGMVEKFEGSTDVDLSGAYQMQRKLGKERMRIYPGAMSLLGNKAHSLSSRTVAVVGIGDDIEEARGIWKG